jgi:hypothetical protein
MPFRKAGLAKRNPRPKEPEKDTGSAFREVGYIHLYPSTKEDSKYLFRFEVGLDSLETCLAGFLYEPKQDHQTKAVLWGGMYAQKKTKNQYTIDFDHQVGFLSLYENQNGRSSNVLYGYFNVASDWDDLRLRVSLYEEEMDDGAVGYSGKVIQKVEDSNQEPEQKPEKRPQPSKSPFREQLRQRHNSPPENHDDTPF